MRKRQRSVNSGALAFLDIMACGLGAVVLVFMLAKRAPEPLDLPDPTPKIATMAALLEEEASLLADLDAITEAQEDAKAGLKGLDARLVELNNNIAEGDAELEAAKLALSQIKDAIKTAPPLQKNDVISLPQGSEENYLTGLKVEGRRIIFALDISTSMVDVALIDILKRKAGKPIARQNGPKWQRTLRVMDWLMARVPERSLFKVITYGDEARLLGSGRWVRGRDKAAIEDLRTSLRQIDPVGGSNLQDALALVNEEDPSHLHLITDGLPTRGNRSYRSLNPFSNCSALSGNAAVISNECRLKLFRQSLLDEKPSDDLVTNVVLLPLEGDSMATLEYWSLAASNGGIVIAPARNWP